MPTTTTMTRDFTLADGRTLDVWQGGDPNGAVLVMHHGTPSDATTYAGWNEVCAARHVRLICASRPGYAGSTRLPGRSIAQAAHDTAELLDQLGIAQFVTAGWSGGGPHALACAALLPGRCLAAATLAGVAPYGEPDLDFLAGMGRENIEEFGLAIEGEASLRAAQEANAVPLRHVTGAELADALGGLIPAIDRHALSGGYADEMAAVMRRALAPGFDGPIDDDLAFTRPWGFAVSDIAVPVTVWQGDLDLMVPLAHGAWLARHIPSAQARMLPGEGHISLVTRYRDEILDRLLASKRAADMTSFSRPQP
jgi:pimeloyl-ACP methyl ester carboxylesterase